MKTIGFILAGVLGAALAAGAAPASSCVRCHGNLEWIQNAAWVKMVQDFESDVHAAVGLSCQDCHGGNADPKLAEDPFAAMDKEFKANPYRGAPGRKDIPDFCGRCHSDANYMKRFKPGERVDQEAEYWTSQHGKLLKGGDTNVATCVDCHGTHGILPPSDVQSRVYPKNVAETCRACHSNPKHMAGYKSKTGGPLPIDQYDRWRRSVHAEALLEKDDLSAPTCNSCHGNHGAVPPQLAAITFVCGQCHGREAGLFRQSPKYAGFQMHNETYLPTMGKDGCAACHDPPAPSARITNITEFSECIICHGNHSVMSPTVAMLAPLPEVPCAYCHEGRQPAAGGMAEPERTVQHYQAVKQQLLAEAERAGLKGDARFDWLVDQTLNLPVHRQAGSREMGAAALQHEFARLFKKFRIGKTYYTYSDPVTGQPVHQKMVRCTDCHGPDSAGFAVSSRMAGDMHELDVTTARAERTLLAAQRGGVEVREAFLKLDKAVDAEIQLQVLLHGFSAATNSDFASHSHAGLQVAEVAMKAGWAGLDELGYRRHGLVVSLGIILCVLVGLGLKIRQLSR